MEWLLDHLIAHRHEKVLVICTKAEIALQLEQVLREREAIRAAVFHQGLSIIERDRAAAYFATEESGAQVLLCSEIGSEGRNFQFASQLVMFDLPFNPDLLEQRIGRLDRIGQMHDIQIMVPYLENTAQAVLGLWFHEGLDAFEHTCPTGRTIYDSSYEQLLNFLAAPTEQHGLDEFIHICRQQHDQLKARLEQGRDRLLEMHSNGGDSAQILANAIVAQDNDINLVSFALNLFDIVGINQDERGDNLIVLTPSDHMLVPDFPGLPQDGCTVTFDRNQALLREDAQFISWEHPIIRNGLDLILSGDIGSCAVSLLKKQGTASRHSVGGVGIRGGGASTEILAVDPLPAADADPHAGGSQRQQSGDTSRVRQFQPPTDCSQLSYRQQVSQYAAAGRSRHVAAGGRSVAEQARTLIEQAKQEADDKLSSELARLEALKVVNPNIRDNELEALACNRHQVLANLNEASWRLDAIRLVVVTHH